MTKERQPFDRRLEIKTRLEAKKPTPNQVNNYIEASVSEDFEKLEPYHQPTKFDIEQKQEVIKRKKRDK